MENWCRNMGKKILGKGSILRKTFLGLLLLSAAMIFSTLLLSNAIEGRNHREQTAVLSLGRLRQSAEFLQTNIDVLAQNMNQTLWAGDTTGFLVTPAAGDPEEARKRTYRILRSLEDAASGNGLITRAFLYSDFQQMILSSDQYVGDAEKYSAWPELKGFLAENRESQNRRVMPAYLELRDGGLYLFCSLEIPAKVGTLVYELNKEALADRMGLADGSGTGEILVYDGERNPVFAGSVDYGVEEPDWDREDSFVRTEDTAAQRNKTRGFYRYDEGNGWSFLMALNTGNLVTGPKDVLRMWLPSAVIFLVLSMGFSWYISRAVYKPVNRLLNLVTETGDNRENAIGSGEIDYLEDAFTDAIDQKNRVRGIVGTIAPEVASSLLQDLISGRQRTEEEVANILQSLGNPVPMTGRFLVIAIGMDGGEAEIPETEVALFLVHMHNLEEQLRRKYGAVVETRTSHCGVCLVIGFSENVSAMELKRVFGGVIRGLESQAGKLPFALRAERGSICRNFMDAGTSYQEALQKLQYREYMKEDGGAEEKADDAVSLNYVRQQSRLVMEKLSGGDLEGADALASRFLESLFAGEGEHANFRLLLDAFMDGITEKAVSLPLSEQDFLTVENLSKIPAQDRETAFRTYRVLAGIIVQYCSKSRFHYIEKAKEYIADKYSDSSLSLTDLGTATGISPSYLSELFKEICGENFSSYLSAYRVDKAAQLLRTTSVTVKEIGFMCGFNSVQNFNRVFKKCRGVTPGAYRSAEKNSGG